MVEMGMEKKEQLKDHRERIDSVLQILRKQASLTLKQEKFCNDACVERFLRAKGDSVKKAAKHLRSVLAWRDSIGTEHLMADEFSPELAEGMGYVAGHDDDARPVVVFRIKQDYPKSRSPKSFVRFLVFTLDVAISSMSRFVDQFVILFDSSFFRSASQLLNLVMGTFKIVADYYPCRLHRAFVVDAPSLFPFLWKGARPFVELWTATTLVSSPELEDSFEGETFASYPRAASLRFETVSTSRIAGGSKSSRFSFTVSRHDALKPWYLNTVAEPSPATAATSPSLIGASPLRARSFSFASPAARSTPRKSVPSTPVSAQKNHPSSQPRTPRPSFLQSPAAALFSLRKDGQQQQHQHQQGKGEKGKEAFLRYLRFYRRPYDEIVYRAKMKPPLGGLVSIVSSHLKHAQQHHHQQQQQQQHLLRRHVTHQQRF